MNDPFTLLGHGVGEGELLQATNNNLRLTLRDVAPCRRGRAKTLEKTAYRLSAGGFSCSCHGLAAGVFARDLEAVYRDLWEKGVDGSKYRA